MKRVLPNVRSAATPEITATPADQLAYLSNVKRLSKWFYTGPRYLMSHNVTPVKWATIYGVLGDGGFITKYADPLCTLGTGFGANTNYLMKDVDRHSFYHPSNDPREFERFLTTLEKIGLNTPVIIQSSHSGGIHVYYFFDRSINTFRTASLAQVTLIDAKFTIKDGTLELFPNCKQFGNKINHKPHRSPLQPNGGGLILDRQGNPLMCGVNLNHETQLAAFLEMADASARGNNIDKVLAKLDPTYEIYKKNPSKYQHLHTHKNEPEHVREWRESREVLMSVGWTGFGETNELIPKFIEYAVVFLGLNNEKDLLAWALKVIPAAPGYSEWCRHQHEIEARILDWIKPTLEQEFYVPYCGHPARSRDRDNFIASYKHSKSVPTSKAEVYKRARVESVVHKIRQTVQTILDTIADIPSRTGDVIKLIQTIGRQIFGQAFSKNTLYKPHYKHIWMKLIEAQTASHVALITPITEPNIEYQAQIVTQSGFEGSVFRVTDPTKTNLKPIGGETWHSAPSVCSVNTHTRPPLDHEVPDPDPDLPSIKNIHPDPDPNLAPNPINSQSAPIYPSAHPIEPDGADLTSLSYSDAILDSIAPDPIESQSALLPAQLNSDTNSQPNQIQPIRDDLTSRSAHDRHNLIDPNSDPDLSPHSIDSHTSFDPIDLHSIDSHTNLDLAIYDTNSQSNQIQPIRADLTSRSAHDRDNPIDSHTSSDPIDCPVVYRKNDRVQLINSDDREHQSTGVVCAIVGSRAMVRWDVSRKINTYPIQNLKLINPKKREISDAQQIFLVEEKSKYLAQLIPYIGCLVISTIDAKLQGLIIAVKERDVYINWQDGSSGQCAIDELRCTYSPCVNNFIQKLINAKLKV